VVLLSEWFDPSPNLFKEKRDSIYKNIPLFRIKKHVRVATLFFIFFVQIT